MVFGFIFLKQFFFVARSNDGIYLFRFFLYNILFSGALNKKKIVFKYRMAEINWNMVCNWEQQQTEQKKNSNTKRQQRVCQD